MIESRMQGFKIITGYDNYYCVNPDGVVIAPSYVDKSGKLRKQKTLKQTKRGKGYFSVGLMKDGEQKHVSVHRLVAQAFIPNPLGLPQVNHKDGVKENNHVSNLEWVTCQENIRHAYQTHLRKGTCKVGEKNTCAKLKEKEVIQILHSGDGAKVLADRYNVTVSTIYKIRSGKRWRHITENSVEVQGA